MKYTLLEATQLILSSMDSDEITSIADSVEATQVANIIRTVYFDIKDRANLPEHFSLVNLTESSASSPVIMTLPTSVSKIKWVKYDKKLLSADPISMQLVDYLPLNDFLDRMHGLDADSTDVDTISHTADSNTFTILFKNDKQPDFYTTFNDNTIIFDSYYSTLETYLRGSKSLCYGKLIPTFSLIDSFTPDLDEEQFPLLINEAKSLAWAELKQTQHQKAEVNSRRGWTRLQKRKFAIEPNSDFHQLPSFGRK